MDTGFNDLPADHVFAGDGELASRMRAFDWAATPLGPVDSWPQSLKTCIRIVLTSRQPMFVWWGDSLINLYNDAYKAIVGGKHPEALGQPAAVVWREIWDQVGPRAETTMRGSTGTYDEALLLIMERHGYQEETYYTFSYSPVPNDAGGTGGLICANSDDTRRIIGERQMALLRDLAASTSDARTLAAACAQSARSLESCPKDVLFAAIYLYDAPNRTMLRAGTAGIEDGHAAAPAVVQLDAFSPWAFADVLQANESRLVPNVEQLFVNLPVGAWSRPSSQAVLLPLSCAGRPGPAGVLLAGLNPYRRFDDAYAGFMTLAAGQISASISNAQAYEDEKRRAEALAELDRVKTTFFSNVSHEFRTPLTLMLGPTEDALAGDGALRGDELATVHRNQLRLLKLVNSLLDFARIEANRAHARYELTDLSELTEDLASAFRSAIERGGLTFEVNCPPLPRRIGVDRQMWEKIVLNLLSNAFKFTFTGTIRIELHAVADQAMLTVQDTGVGIAADQLPHVFERFHRVEGQHGRTHEGTGIGLALVRELARLHEGSVRVTSAPGAGTTFAVTIPMSLPAEAEKTSDAALLAPSSAVSVGSYVEEALRWLPSEMPGRPSAADAGVPPAAGIRPRILLADDNADMREYLGKLLGARWDVEAVANGVEAMAAARQSRPDVIVTDVMMPTLDGFGLLKELRADPQLRNIAVMMLSARAGEEARIEGIQAGADDYIVKPFSARELVARVEAQVLRVQMRALEDRQRRELDAVFRQAPAAITIMRGPDHVFEMANDAYLDLVARRDIVGKPVMEALPELAEQGVLELLDGVYRTGQPFVGKAVPVTVQRHTHQSPEECFFDFVYQPLIDDDGRVTGIVAVIFEVSELVKARKSAEAASRAKDEFLAMLGHELRNPLAPILTAVQLMRLRDVTPAGKELAVIERQARHLIRLVDDLLDVSRVTRGKIELRKERTELAEIVTRAIETTNPLIERQEHELRIDVPASGLPLYGDPSRLAQVIANLLTNAAKYTPKGGRISVSAGRDGDTIVLTVIDTGIGIAPDVLPRIFDMFVQDGQALARSQGGLGLGLTIVRSIMDLHGGTVAAHSDGVGAGSTFTVRLPAASALPGTPATDALEAADALAFVPGPGSRQVLVVDDNEDAAAMLAEALRSLGHAVHVAYDGPSALELARRLPLDLALLDLGLPVMDGYELARHLRAGCLAPITLVAVTGYGQERDNRESAEAGFDAHLVKPITIEMVKVVLAEHGQ